MVGINMKQVIAIGGGGFTDEKNNLKIEKYLLAQVKKEKPKICLLPQASGESQAYILKFFETFVKLGAEPSWISLFGLVNPSWKQHLLNQDIIYVGGGNFRSLLALWKAWEMDKMLIEAYNKGIILSGISSGAGCWFEQGVTYSVWPVGILDGLGLIDGSCCPHFDTEIKMQDFYKSKIQTMEIKPGFALEDETGLHFVDGKLTNAIKSIESKKAIKIDARGETIIESVILDDME